MKTHRVDITGHIATRQLDSVGMNERLRDSAVRVELGISQRVAAKLIGVGVELVVRYEIDERAVHDAKKRAKCAAFYGELRRLLSREWLAKAA